jgi:NDP-sugar pyrophosphorylase family protein
MPTSGITDFLFYVYLYKEEFCSMREILLESYCGNLNMKLVVLAAGKGKRFLPITNTTPKGMILIQGKPLLKHIIEPYLPHVSDIIFVISKPLGMQIKAYFKENYLGHKVFYKIQKEQRGTMDALLACKDLVNDDELFCVCNGDDLLQESDIKSAVEQKITGLGVSRKVMPKSYLGINMENGYIAGFRRHDREADEVEDLFYNGFNVLNKKIFGFEPIATRDGELGLPHTLFTHLDTYPLKAFTFESWETVNRPEDIAGAEKFLRSYK